MENKTNVFTGANWNESDDSYTQTFLDLNHQNFWLPTEIPLSDDLMVWNTLSDDVKQAYSKNLAVLTFLDTWQGDSGMNIICRSLNQGQHQRKALLSFMQAVENSIHAKSYSNIFMTYLSVLDIDDLFRWCENNVSMQKILHHIVDKYQELEKAIHRKEYNKNISENDYKIAQYKAMVASVFLESALFYTGFYYPLFFAGQGKLTKAGEIISLIIRDECLTGDAELLTPKGWKKISEINKGDIVLEYDSVQNRTQFNKVINTSKKYEDEIYTLKNKSGFYQRTSGGHRLVYKNGDEIAFSTMRDFTPSKDKKFIKNALFKNSNSSKLHLNFEETLKIAIQQKGEIKEQDDNVFVVFNLNDIQNYPKLKERIEEFGYLHEETSNEYIITIPTHFIKESATHLFENYDLTTLSRQWCIEFIFECENWSSNNVLTSVNQKWLEFVNSVATLAGFTTHLIEYSIEIDTSVDSYYVDSTSCEKIVEKDDFVYGVQVPSTNLVVKQNGCVSITGNCVHGLYVGMLTDEILQSLDEDTREQLKDWVIQFLNQLYELELDLIEDIYSTVGLTHDVRVFLRYNFNKALMNLNLPTYFIEEDVNPVVLRGIDVGNKQIDYFSQKGDSYSKRKLEELLNQDFIIEEEPIC